MNTKFQIAVKPLQERIAEIAHEEQHAKRTQRFHEYRNERKDLPVVRLPITLPMYRVANYRTSLQQLRWIKEKQKTIDYFSAGEENESVQKIQHAFLWDLAQTQKESIASIIETLKSESQRDPLLLSSSGIVVNGNRRLAAMRELFATNPDTCGHFSHVDCMLLPSEATEDDMKDIEVRLQMTPETRLPYDWISECIAIRDLINRGRDPELIAAMMRLKSKTEVLDKFQMLTEIDLYLKDWKGASGDYEALNDAEEIVSQMNSRLKKKEGVQKEVARRLGWILVDHRGSEGRIYDLRDVTGNLTTLVINKLQEVYPNETTSEEAASSDDDSGDFELELTDGVSPEQRIVSFLEGSKNNDLLKQEIVNVCRVVVEAQKVQRAGNAALKAIQDANTKLLEVDINTADRQTYKAIGNQLDAIEQRVGHLKSLLEKIK
jgi:hypothetical protein